MSGGWTHASVSGAVLAAAVALPAIGAAGVSASSRRPQARPRTADVRVVAVAYRDLRTSQDEQATLGYADERPTASPMTGTLTWLPRPGQLIGRGGILIRVDTRPVVVFYGSVPAWRTLRPGGPPGS